MTRHGHVNPAYEYELEETDGGTESRGNGSSEQCDPDLLVNANYAPNHSGNSIPECCNENAPPNVPKILNPLRKSADLENSTDIEYEDSQCGFGCFRPKWIQRFATKKVFIMVFTILGICQAMTASYFNATITTLEKRFKISSQTTGIIMTGNEISQIIFALVLSYYGGKGHRPRWIAAGVMFFAMSCFLLASPHIFYGSGEDLLALTEEYAPVYGKGPLDIKPKNMSSFFGTKSVNSSKAVITLCERSSSEKEESCDVKEASIIPLFLLFLSQFVAGIGILITVTLGGPYLDDNTKRDNFPFVLGMTISFKTIGPLLGFLIASGTLKLFVNPLLNPIISNVDPRFVGAWWLGWVIFGVVIILISFILALFPNTLKDAPKSMEIPKAKTEKPTEAVSSFSEITHAVKALLKNKVNMYCKISMLFYSFAGTGYWTYMPKYMETIFMQTASSASIISGAVGIVPLIAGLMISGSLISKFKFSARKVQGWSCFVGCIFVLATIVFTQIGCNVGTISFGTESSDGTWNLTSACNNDCNCKTNKILPVCHKETNTVYYSACHAGCTFEQNNQIGNCSCIPDPETGTVTLGNCAEGCDQVFMVFLVVSAIIQFFDASIVVGNTLVSLRCVGPEERSLSLGLSILLISGLSLLPAPIVFGRIIDNVCLVWGGSSCGKRGNCMLYDGKRLRYLFNITAAVFSSIGLFFDCLVFYYVKGLDLYPAPDCNTNLENNNDSNENEKKN